MSDPKKHHHVPQFLLDGWRRADGRVAVYSRKANRLVIDWRTPEHTAFEPHLYSISALPEDREWVEREVMSKHVDGPAAPVLQRLLAGDLEKFDSDDRTAMARFMLAQWYRSPEMIAKIRQGGRDAMLRALEANPEEYHALRGSSAHESLVEWAEAHMPGYDEIATMGSVLPKLINDGRAGQIIINMNWEVLHLLNSKFDLLTSDRPVTRFESLLSRNCMIVMPLDPRHLFVASNWDRNFQRYSPTELARRANVTTVTESVSRVYGTGTHHRPLAEKWLSQKGVV
jgi:hypothetical protein